ncbi:MAG TPA: SRPBCC domain-containing protein [Baekduia sp.]|nr:SRPBCC domain-containing protein [Baekduia sp.]
MTRDNLTKITMLSDVELEYVIHFDAPLALVYEMWTEAEQLEQWCMPEGLDLKVVEQDVHVGGGLRWEWHDEDEYVTMGLSADFVEVVPYSRIGLTEYWDGQPRSSATAHEISFTREENATKVTGVLTFVTADLALGAATVIPQILDEQFARAADYLSSQLSAAR